MAHPVEALLRKPVEYWSATTGILLAGVAWVLQHYMLFTPAIGKALAIAFLGFGLYRAVGGYRIERYQRQLSVLKPFRARNIPGRKNALYLGAGFRWGQQHTQRLRDARSREGAMQLERFKRKAIDAAISGTPELHTVGLWEGVRDIWIDDRALKGHLIVIGTTGAGKTRLAEIKVEQDIRRGCTVIVFDPKGDADLLTRVYSAAKRAARLDDFQVLHLAHPEISARYNPIGSFTRITQVAQRLSEPLPDQGNSAAFREFAWRFSNIIARALAELGETPDLTKIRRYVNDIEPLMLRYIRWWFDQIGESSEYDAIKNASTKKSKGGYSERAKKASAVARRILNAEQHYDPVVEGLISVIDYERNYYDKIVSSLLPLLEKLTTGKVGELLSPRYSDSADERDIIDWGTVIRKNRIVYVGLDALTDPIVAGAVGQAMFDDLTSVAGELYAYGEAYGVEKASGDGPVLPSQQISIHADELSAIASESVLNLLARGRGAGMELTCYTQTIHDLTTGLGNRDLARVAIGNLNTLIMLRVRDDQTARLLTDQLPKVDVQKLMQVSGAHDSAMPASDVEFTSSTQQRITTQEVPMIDPGDVTRLPIGHAFVLGEGGQLYKTWLPLPASEDTDLPQSLVHIVNAMRSQRAAGENWWGDTVRRQTITRGADFSGAEIDIAPDAMTQFDTASTDLGALDMEGV